MLIDLATYASGGSDLKAFMDYVVTHVSAALEIDHVKVLRYRSDRNDLLLEAGIGWAPGVVGSAAFATDMASPVGRAFQTGQPVKIDDFSTAPDFRASEVLRTHGIVSLLNVPVSIDGAVWGVIEVDSTVLRGFTADTLQFMHAVAALVGMAIRRMQDMASGETLATDRTRELLKRDLMLREMQHRVKNNFQVILGMVQLRKPSLPVQAGRDAMDQIANGIMAMSLAHDQLSPSRSGEMLELGAYLKALTAAFVATMERILIEVKSDEVNVTIEQALPLGLIVNELITNSIKHAFGPDGGAIRVELHAPSRQGFATLIVADNGRGLGQARTDGSGLKLIDALAAQARAELIRSDAGKGTSTQLRFVPRG
ncbi:sensor histidine kinase [Phenylobacterium sp.]|uniref:sensor histidine kinase n=1 Tax=Phenylobacterium sp. TaxID=1871053 RepID=UPI002F42FA96